MTLQRPLLALALSASLFSCDEKKPAPPAVTAPEKPAAAQPSAPPSAAPPQTAESRKPARRLTLRQLIWTEKTPAETKYVDCMVKSCVGSYKHCYGEKVEEGELSGPCGELASCASKCLSEPNDAKEAACRVTCLDTHKKEGGACDKCEDAAAACSEKSKCTPPIEMPH